MNQIRWEKVGHPGLPALRREGLCGSDGLTSTASTACCLPIYRRPQRPSSSSPYPACRGQGPGGDKDGFSGQVFVASLSITKSPAGPGNAAKSEERKSWTACRCILCAVLDVMPLLLGRSGIPGPIRLLQRLRFIATAVTKGGRAPGNAEQLQRCLALPHILNCIAACPKADPTKAISG
jgi:hypothetical protein